MTVTFKVKINRDYPWQRVSMCKLSCRNDGVYRQTDRQTDKLIPVNPKQLCKDFILWDCTLIMVLPSLRIISLVLLTNTKMYLNIPSLSFDTYSSFNWWLEDISQYGHHFYTEVQMFKNKIYLWSIMYMYIQHVGQKKIIWWHTQKLKSFKAERPKWEPDRPQYIKSHHSP